MNSRCLLSAAATPVLAVAGLIAPTSVTQRPPAAASLVVSVSSSAPTYDPIVVTAGTRAQSQPVTAPTKRTRIRPYSHNSTITIISWILAILIVSGGILVRYAIFKTTQHNSIPPTALNGLNSPQYDVIGSNHGIPGAGYGTAGTGYGTTGTGYGIAADVIQPGFPVYGTNIYGHQQGVQRLHGTGS